MVVSDSLPHLPSTFGHAAIIVNGKAYSRAHEVYFTEDAQKYIDRQRNVRGSLGYVLKTTGAQDALLEAELERRVKENDEYDFMSNSCSSNIADVLEMVHIETRGPWQTIGIAPVDLAVNLPKTGKVKEVRRYEQFKK